MFKRSNKSDLNLFIFWTELQEASQVPWEGLGQYNNADISSQLCQTWFSLEALSILLYCVFFYDTSNFILITFKAVYTSPSNFPAIFLNGVQINQNEKCFICFMIKWKPYIAFFNNTQEVWAASSSGEKNQRGTLHMISWSVPLYVLLADDLAEFKSWFI